MTLSDLRLDKCGNPIRDLVAIEVEEDVWVVTTKKKAEEGDPMYLDFYFSDIEQEWVPCEFHPGGEKP